MDKCLNLRGMGRPCTHSTHSANTLYHCLCTAQETVVGDKYVSTHAAWLFNSLITRAILTHKEFLVFHPNSRKPEQCTHNGGLRQFNPAAITGVIGDMIAKLSIQIELHNGCKGRTLCSSQRICTTGAASAHCYPAEHAMLQSWLHAKFQLESIPLYSQHYPHSRRAEQPIYVATPFLQGNPGQDLFPPHSHFYQPFPHQPSSHPNACLHLISCALCCTGYQAISNPVVLDTCLKE